jgi:hypothetical protein
VNELKSKEMEDEERPWTIYTVEVRAFDKVLFIFKVGE